MDTKYDVSSGEFVNRKSGEAIPPEEPCFIFRARDVNAVDAITFYASLCTNSEHQDEVIAVAQRFEDWALANPEKMKEPDT